MGYRTEKGGEKTGWVGVKQGTAPNLAQIDEVVGDLSASIAFTKRGQEGVVRREERRLERDRGRGQGRNEAAGSIRLLQYLGAVAVAARNLSTNNLSTTENEVNTQNNREISYTVYYPKQLVMTAQESNPSYKVTE